MGGIIDGRRWVKARIAHLEGLLADGDLDDEVRTATEAELAGLRDEQRAGRGRRWWRLLGGPRL